MRKVLVSIACIAALTACGTPAEEQARGEDDGAAAELSDDAVEQGDGEGSVLELGVLEEALNEATCGTATVNRNSNFGGVGALARVNPPYGSAACTRAFLQGVKAAAPKTMDMSIFSQISANATDCPRTQFHAIYFANGTRVRQVDGLPVFRGGTRCVNSVLVRFSPTATAVSVSGNILTIPGGAPAAAANARLALQGLNAAGALQSIDVEVTRFQ